jgi:hypothetical protein
MLKSIISSATFEAAATADLLIDRRSGNEVDSFLRTDGGIALGVNVAAIGRFWMEFVGVEVVRIPRDFENFGRNGVCNS